LKFESLSLYYFKRKSREELIHGINGIHQVVGKLEALELDLYLTGSRFFNTEGPQSDWDFFVENTEKIESILKELEFEALEKYDGYAYDLNTAKIFRRKFPKGDQIDIQLAKNVQLRIDAQKLIKESQIPLHKMNRGQAQKLWNLVYRSLNYSGFYALA
jgi:hypothetical protein